MPGAVLFLLGRTYVVQFDDGTRMLDDIFRHDGAKQESEAGNQWNNPGKTTRSALP